MTRDQSKYSRYATTIFVALFILRLIFDLGREVLQHTSNTLENPCVTMFIVFSREQNDGK